LGGRGTFKLILDQNLRSWDGPIGMSIAPSPEGVTRPRLGISIGRPVGNAVKRNRIKRLLREAFRALRADWPTAYDVVVLVKPHETGLLSHYQKSLINLKDRCLTKHQRRTAAPPSAG